MGGFGIQRNRGVACRARTCWHRRMPRIGSVACCADTSSKCAALLDAVPGVQAVLPELLGLPDPWYGGSELSRIVAGRLLMEAGTISECLWTQS